MADDFEAFADEVEGFATELEFLKWFYHHADFSPTETETHLYLEQQFVEETGKKVPRHLTWFPDEDEE